MSLETEAVFKAFSKYFDENKGKINGTEDFNKLADEFLADYNKKDHKNGTPTTADDYLILARKAQTKEKAISYTRKAIELEPDNLDANLEMISLQYGDDANKRLEELDKLKKKADDEYTKNDAFNRYEGRFYTFYETRPYMRVREAHFMTLIECRMIGRAIEEAKEMMKLNKDDNLGIRYTLAPLYVFIEDEKHLLSLSKKSQDDPPFLLALSVLYYKLRDYDKAGDYLRKLSKENKDTKKFLRAVINEDIDTLSEGEVPGAYRPRTIEELAEAYFSNFYLYSSMGPYFYWAYKTLSKK